MGLDGMSFAHPLPLCPLLPLSGGRGARPLDVEMPEAVMKNGNKRIQTKVRLRGYMEEGGDQRIHTQVMRAVRLEKGKRGRGGEDCMERLRRAGLSPSCCTSNLWSRDEFKR